MRSDEVIKRLPLTHYIEKGSSEMVKLVPKRNL